MDTGLFFCIGHIHSHTGLNGRICGDYRITVNRFLKQTNCSTPEPEDILRQYFRSKFFKLDLREASLEILLGGKSRELITTDTPFGLFQYNVLPFRLNVSSAIFHNLMNTIVSDLSGITTYHDDINVHAATKKLHDECSRLLLKRFRDYDVAINSDN